MKSPLITDEHRARLLKRIKGFKKPKHGDHNQMNQKEYYLTCAIEEAAELIEELGQFIKRASKVKRFGLTHIAEGQDLTNGERLQEEVNDLLCGLSHLATLGIIELDGITPRFNKGKRFEEMLELSRKLGTLKDE